MRNMRDLAREFPCTEIWQQLLPNCPWGHLLHVMFKVKDPSEREWYVRACIEQGWSRNLLARQIESGLHRREGVAVTNFERTLPPPDSDLAQQTIKDPYNFDFLTLSQPVREQVLKDIISSAVGGQQLFRTWFGLCKRRAIAAVLVVGPWRQLLL